METSIVLQPIYYNPEYLSAITIWRNIDKMSLRGWEDISVQIQKEWIESLYKNPSCKYYYIYEFEKENEAEKPTFKCVGYCGIDKIHLANRTGEISILIGYPYKDKEYGKPAITQLLEKAFDEWNLNLVYADVYSTTDNHLFWIECDFTEEAVLKDRKYWGGRYWDSRIMTITKKEFKLKKS